jgi:hypothetical protein
MWAGDRGRDSPLNELARKRPSEVISRYSTSATKVGSTHVALGFLIGLVSFDFGLTTRIELLPDLARDRSGPSGADLADVDQVLALLLPQVKRGDSRWILHPMTGNLPF